MGSQCFLHMLCLFRMDNSPLENLSRSYLHRVSLRFVSETPSAHTVNVHLLTRCLQMGNGSSLLWSGDKYGRLGRLPMSIGHF